MKNMMRLTVSVMLFLLIWVPVLGQNGPTPSPLTSLMPAEAYGYISVRTDEAFFEQLESLSDLVLPMVPESMRPGSLAELIEEQALSQYNVTVADLLAWFGDHAAVSVYPSEFSSESAVGIIEVADRNAVEAFLTQLLADNYVVETVGDATVFVSEPELTRVWLTDTHLYLTDFETDYDITAAPAESLVAAPRFQAVIETMPEPTYNVFIFGHSETMEAGMSPVEGFIGVGLTILDDKSLTIDTAVNTEAFESPLALPAVDNSFASLIPADVDGVIQLNDLAALYAELRSIAAREGNESDFDAFEAQLASAGIDFKSEVLSWATGSYALLYRADTDSLIEQAGNDLDALTGAGLVNSLDGGILFQTNNADLSTAFYQEFSALVALASLSDDAVTSSQAEMDGTPVTIIAVEIPFGPDDTDTLELVIGANDEVFVVATRQLAEDIFAGGESLADTALFEEINVYALPETYSIIYGNSEAVLGAMVVPAGLVFLGPTIENVFDDIITQIDPDAATPVPTPTPVPATSDSELVDAVTYALASISSGSISSTVTPDGTTVSRIVLTIHNEGSQSR
jgi:hypothetical protein